MPRATNFVQRYCSVEACSRKHYAKGLCSRHYGQWRITGNPIASRTYAKNGDPIRWLRSHVQYNSDDCLIWPFARSPQGYPLLGPKFPRSGHRLMCKLAHGNPQDIALQAAHSCGRGHDGCINPRHLRWASRSENEQDKRAHKTSNDGERNGMAKLSEIDVHLIRQLDGRTSHEQIARMFGVIRQTIDKIISGVRWTTSNMQQDVTTPKRDRCARATAQGWWRRRVLKRDGFRCQRCGCADRVNLNAHHIEPYSRNETLRWDVGNGSTLCASCHLAYHRLYGVKNANATTFAAFVTVETGGNGAAV